MLDCFTLRDDGGSYSYGGLVSSSEKIRCISAARKGNPAISAACPPPRHPQGEAIRHTRMDCFTLRMTGATI
jgi:hypothetical protein